MVLCSHKKNVLDFLDQLCSLYQQKYFHTSAVEVDKSQAFIDKVCDLAEANGLPSEGYRSVLPEFSADEVRRQLSKVLLVALPFKQSHSAAHLIHQCSPLIFMFSFDSSTF